MENQTRFDLNAAIENWRQELAAQPDLASDDRRELETHLRDTIVGFQQRGLNDEESFWLARRRVGQPQQLGEEFVKADPAKVWRERGFWIAATILLAFLWRQCASLMCLAIFYYIRNLSINFGHRFEWFQQGENLQFVEMLFDVLPLLGLTILLIKRRMSENSFLRFFARNRVFISILIGLWIITWGVLGYWNAVSFNKIAVETNHLIAIAPMSPGNVKMLISLHPVWMDLGRNLFFPTLLLALVLWLMPTQNRKTPKRA